MSASVRWSTTKRKTILAARAVVLLLTSGGAVAAQKFLITGARVPLPGALTIPLGSSTHTSELRRRWISQSNSPTREPS